MSYPDGFHEWPLDRRDEYFAEEAAKYRERKIRERGNGSASLAAMTLPARLTNAPSATAPAYTRGLKSMNGEELLTAKFPPRTLMLSPWLPDKGLAMIFAPRGVGKTWIALSIAHAIAGGGAFLRWQATTPRRVLYIDGEMPAVTLQERYGEVIRASKAMPRNN